MWTHLLIQYFLFYYYLKWFFFADKPCDLHCVPRDGREMEVIGVFVADGTPCRSSLGSRDMCISGMHLDIIDVFYFYFTTTGQLDVFTNIDVIIF